MAEVSASPSAVALTFQFPAYELRTVMRDGEPWFVAADVCAALDIGNVSMALRRLDDDEQTLISTEGQAGHGAQSQNLINESGLYSLILGSRKPEAKKFKKWVTSEVLPAIRKTGRYEQFATSALESAWTELDGVYDELGAAQTEVNRLQTQLVRSQASQLRLMRNVIGLQKRWNTREARDTMVRMEREGFDRHTIAAATGRTLNHVRQVVFHARAVGELPPKPEAAQAQPNLFEGA
jgi:prophage antirepressor-like protein